MKLSLPRIGRKLYQHCVKSIRICSFSSSYFVAFGLNTERYSVSLSSLSEFSINAGK